MTVSYTGDVANTGSFGALTKILFKWRGSIYKLVYKEIVSRWWKQYVLLPWPDSFGMMVTGLYNTGGDKKARMMRRNIIRYITLSYCWSKVSLTPLETFLLDD